MRLFQPAATRSPALGTVLGCTALAVFATLLPCTLRGLRAARVVFADCDLLRRDLGVEGDDAAVRAWRAPMLLTSCRSP